MRQQIKLLLLIFSFFSCTARTEDQTLSKTYVSTANLLLAKYPMYDDSLTKGISLANRAITLDSANIFAYQIKAQLESSLGLYESSLSDVNYIIAHRDDMSQFLLVKGFILWKLAKIDSAKKVFRLVIAKYESLDSSKSHSYANWYERAILYILTGDKKRGLQEYEQLKAAYPNQQSLFSDSTYIRDLDQEKFINSALPRAPRELR